MQVEYKPAIGSVRNIIWNEKTREVMGCEGKVVTFYGATGNGKSMLGMYKFLSRVYKSGRYSKNFYLVGKDIKTLERRFVASPNSVLNWVPFLGKWEYKERGEGGSRIEVKTQVGMKYIYLTPFGNIRAASRMLGDTIHGALVDEAVDSDELLLQELHMRVHRTVDSFMILTSNGGDKEHYFYTGIVNKSNWIGEVPYEEREYFYEEREKDYWFVHMMLEDNLSYTDEQLRVLYGMFPVGSYMYNSRILGIRGYGDNSPFLPYMKDYWVGMESAVSGVHKIAFSVDVGGHVFSKKEMEGSAWEEGAFGTGKGGHTVMVVGGFDRRYSNFYLLDTYFPNYMEESDNIERINHKVLDVRLKYPYARLEYMFCDNASPSMLSGLMNKVKNVGQVMGAVKRDSSIDMDEKVVVTLIQQYMMMGKFFVVDNENNRKWFIPAIRAARQEGNGKLLDNLSWESDVMDALKYIFSTMYRFLIENNVLLN